MPQPVLLIGVLPRGARLWIRQQPRRIVHFLKVSFPKEARLLVVLFGSLHTRFF